MVSVDVLLKQRVQLPVRSLNEVQNERLKVAGASRNRSLHVAFGSRCDMARATDADRAKGGQFHNALVAQVFEKGPAFFVLASSGGPLPVKDLAEGFRKFGQAEVGEIAGGLADDVELGRGEGATGKFQSGLRHAVSPVFPGYATKAAGKCPAKSSTSAISKKHGHLHGWAWMEAQEFALSRADRISVSNL
jgi:hypothetical protein